MSTTGGKYGRGTLTKNMPVIDLVTEMHDAGIDYWRTSLPCGCKLEPQNVAVLEAAEKPEHLS